VQYLQACWLPEHTEIAGRRFEYSVQLRHAVASLIGFMGVFICKQVYYLMLIYA
jgi:hypothetical protein